MSKPRNPHAIAARRRKGGPMRHKNAPRGGTREQAIARPGYDDPRCTCSLHDMLRYWYTKGCPIHCPLPQGDLP